EIDVSKLFIRQPFTQTSIRIERRVNSHSLRRAQESHDETVLHERLAAAQRKTSRHDLQTVTILAEGRDCALERDRHSVHHVPRVRVVTVQAAELAARGPRHQANTRTIDRRAGCESMQKPN